MLCVVFQISTNAAVQHLSVATTIKYALILVVAFSVSVMAVSTDQNASTVSLLIIDIILSHSLVDGIVLLIVKLGRKMVRKESLNNKGDDPLHLDVKWYVISETKHQNGFILMFRKGIRNRKMDENNSYFLSCKSNLNRIESFQRISYS